MGHGHTPEPWVDSPKASGAIISQDPDAMTDAGMEVGYYGGALICESVEERNKPLIKAAPGLLAACQASYDLLVSWHPQHPDDLKKKEKVIRQLSEVLAKGDQ